MLVGFITGENQSYFATWGSPSMKPERPVIVLVFAILNLVFGGMGIVSFICGGVAVAFVFAILSNSPAGRTIPSFPSGLVVFFAVIFVYGFIMAVVLTISGVGLLNMKRWARNTAIAYSIITIAYSITTTVINITYAGPTIQKWQKDLQEEVAREQQRKGQPPPPAMNDPTQSPIFNMVASIGGAIFGMAYAIALLVVMLLPQVSAAFAEGRSRPQPDLDRDQNVEFED
jgi:hypothetical protein